MEQAADMITEEEVTTPIKDKVPVKCVCGYRWKTKTALQYISCPNCRHTNKLEDAIQREKDHALMGGDR